MSAKILITEFDTPLINIPNPDPGFYLIGVDTDGILKKKDSAGVIVDLEAAGTLISGTPGYLQKMNDTGNNVVDSLIFDNGVGVGIGTNNPSGGLHIISNESNLFRVQNGSFVFSDKLSIHNSGNFYSGSINNFGAFGTGNFVTDHLNYTFNTSFSTYLAFTNAGLAGNRSSYGIIGGTIGNADSAYRLVVLNNDSNATGNVLKVVSTVDAAANDGFDYDHFALNVETLGTMVNSGSGSFNKVGVRINVGGGDVNKALVIAGGSFQYIPGASAGKILMSDANGIATWETAPAGGTTISGLTQNYLTKANATGDNIVDSQVFDNGTNVGIGHSSPSYKLDVNGDIAIRGISSRLIWNNGTANYELLKASQGNGGVNVSLGDGNTITDGGNGGAVMIGAYGSSFGEGIAIGLSASVGLNTYDGVAIGRSATISAGVVRGLAFGRNATVSHDDSIAFGPNTSTGATSTIVLGNNLDVGIGTNVPQGMLHVYKAGFNIAKSIVESDSNVAELYLNSFKNSQGTSGGSKIYFNTLGVTKAQMYVNSANAMFQIDNFQAGGSMMFSNNSYERLYIGNNLILMGDNTSWSFGMDIVNKRLAIGTYATPTATLHIRGIGTTSGTASLKIENSAGLSLLTALDNGNTYIGDPNAYQGTSFYYKRINPWDSEWWFNPNQTNGGTSSNLYLNVWQTRWGAPSASSGFAQINRAVMSLSDNGIYLALNTHNLTGGSNAALQVGYEKGSGAGGPGMIGYFQYNDIYAINAPGNTLIRGVVIDNSSGTWTNVGGTSTRVGLDIYVGNSTFNHTAILRGGNVYMGTSITYNTPDASALLELSSTTQGFLPPRMTTAQRTAIASPAEGLIVYDTDTKKSYTFDGTTWQQHF